VTEAPFLRGRVQGFGLYDRGGSTTTDLSNCATVWLGHRMSTSIRGPGNTGSHLNTAVKQGGSYSVGVGRVLLCFQKSILPSLLKCPHDSVNVGRCRGSPNCWNGTKFLLTGRQAFSLLSHFSLKDENPTRLLESEVVCAGFRHTLRSHNTAV